MKQHIHLSLFLCLLAGCISTAPVIPPRYQLNVPSANGADSRVYISTEAGRENSYTISFIASTNIAENLRDDPDWATTYWDIHTNTWPWYRNNIDLSLDGGQTWTRRIGSGIPRDSLRHGGEFVWSPPMDYTLMTTNAKIRITDLDGNPYAGRSPPRPYDPPAGQFIQSPIFEIVGATITAPAGGSIQWRGQQTDVTWVALGTGPVCDLYWLTPTSVGADMTHWITTISNCVDGVNTKRISLNVPVADALKLVLIPQADPLIHGYSGSFTVDP